MKKIIIDTDPGIDDAYAIFFALCHPHIDVLALTSVHGNVEVDLAAENALRLAELAGHDIPVAQGALRPRNGNKAPSPQDIHGKNGLGDVSVPDFKGRLLDEHAAATIVRLVRAHPGEVTLVPIGPLTNIALALDLAPDLEEKVAGVTLMGGAAQVAGNITPAAEANIFHDPHAADRVFSAKWPIVMAGLDATMQVTFSAAQIDQIAETAPHLGGWLKKFSGLYVDFYKRARGLNGVVPHDLLAVMAITHPEIFSTRTGRIRIACEGPAAGATVFWPSEKLTRDAVWEATPERTILTGVSSDKVFSIFTDTLKGR